jgi:hypothetical protein
MYVLIFLNTLDARLILAFELLAPHRYYRLLDPRGGSGWPISVLAALPRGCPGDARGAGVFGLHPASAHEALVVDAREWALCGDDGDRVHELVRVHVVDVLGAGACWFAPPRYRDPES